MSSWRQADGLAARGPRRCHSAQRRIQGLLGPACLPACPLKVLRNYYRLLVVCLKNFLCVPTDELLRAEDDLLSEGGQSLSPREGEKGRKGIGKGNEEGKERGEREWEKRLASHTIFRPWLVVQIQQSVGCVCVCQTN